MIGILLLLSFFYNFVLAFYSDLYSFPPYSGFSSLENSDEHKTFYMIDPSQINTIVSKFGGFIKNHTLKLTSVEINLHSHVIYRGNSLFALCSIDDPTILGSNDATLSCDFTLSYQNNIIAQSSCGIGLDQTKCVAEIFPDPKSILISTDLISFELQCNVSAYNDRTGKLLENFAKNFIFKNGQYFTIHQIIDAEFTTYKITHTDSVVFRIKNQIQEYNFSLYLDINSRTESFYFELNLPSNVRNFSALSSNPFAWSVNAKQIASEVYALEIKNLRNATDDGDLSLEIGLQLQMMKRGHRFRRTDIIIDKMNLYPSNVETTNLTKFTLKTPRIIPDKGSMYIFTQFHTIDYIQIPWSTPNNQLKASKKINVIGYIPGRREFINLNDQIHCRVAKNKLGSSKNFLYSRLDHIENFNPCPREMHESSERVEYPLPNENLIPGKETAFGTGLEFHEQMIFSLGPVEYDVVIDPIYGYSQDTDCSWRVWRGPYMRVWNVDEIKINLDRDRLEKIDNWWYSNPNPDISTCLPAYEHSKITISGNLFLTRMSNREKISLADKRASSLIDLTTYLTPESLVLAKKSSSIAQIYWSNVSGLPIVVGSNPGEAQINLISKDYSKILATKTINVGSSKSKSVVSMEVFCGNPELTIFGGLSQLEMIPRHYDKSNLNYPLARMLSLNVENELLRSVLYSEKDRNLMKDVYDNNQDNGIVIKSPGLTFNDSCEVNKVLINLILNDNSKLSLANQKERRTRLTARMKGDYRLTWDPGMYISENLEKEFIPSIHLTDLEVWSSNEACSKSTVIFPGQEEKELSLPVVTMDLPFKKAQSTRKWLDPGTINEALYIDPREKSLYFKNLLLKLTEDGSQSVDETKGSFDNRIIYGIVGAVLLIAAILMFIQVRTIIKYKKKKNFCEVSSSMLNSSSGNCYKNESKPGISGQNQTYTDLTQSPQDPMSCCSLASSTMMKTNNQPLFISPQNPLQNNQFCGQVSPSSFQMTTENFQTMCQQQLNNSCMGSPMLMSNSNMISQNGCSSLNGSNSKTNAMSPLIASMQARVSPDLMNHNQMMWTSQMHSNSFHPQVLQNNPVGNSSSKMINPQYSKFGGGGSLSSNSDINVVGNSSLLQKQYDANNTSFRGNSPMNRQNTASPLTQSSNNNWNFNQLLPYSLPENPDGTECVKMTNPCSYNNSGLGSVGTCSDEGIGTASSPHHRYNSDFINGNSISSSCGWSNIGNKFNPNAGISGEDHCNQLICPPPMECLSTVKNSITSRTSSLKNSATFRSDAHEFSPSILPPVHMSSREHSVNSNPVPKSFIQPSDSSDVLVSMMGDVFGYETDTSRTNSISKLENLSIPTEL